VANQALTFDLLARDRGFGSTFRKAGRDVETTGKKFDLFNKKLGDSFKRNQSSARLVGDTLKEMKIPAIASSVSLLSAAFSAASGTAFSLVAQLAPLSGALAAYPVLLSAVGQGLGVFKLATSSIKDATKALITYGAKSDQFKKATKGLSQSQIDFVFVLAGVRKEIAKLSQVAGKALFPGFTSAIRRLATNYLPIFRTAIKTTGGVLSDLAVQASKVASTAVFKRDIGVILGRNASILKVLGSAGLGFAVALKNIMVAAGPMTTEFALLAEQAGKFLAKITSGRGAREDMLRFFDRTVDTAKIVGRTLRDLGIAIYNIGRIAAEAVGIDFVGAMEDGAAKLRDFTESATGVNKIGDYFAGQRPTILAFGSLIRDLTMDIGKLGANEKLAELVELVRVDLLPALFDLAHNVTDELGPVVIHLATSWARAMAALHTEPILETVSAFSLLILSMTDLIDLIPGLSYLIPSIIALGLAGKGLAVFGKLTGIVMFAKIISALRGGAGIRGVAVAIGLMSAASAKSTGSLAASTVAASGNAAAMNAAAVASGRYAAATELAGGASLVAAGQVTTLRATISGLIPLFGAAAAGVAIFTLTADTSLKKVGDTSTSFLGKAWEMAKGVAGAGGMGGTALSKMAEQSKKADRAITNAKEPVRLLGHEVSNTVLDVNEFSAALNDLYSEALGVEGAQDNLAQALKSARTQIRGSKDDTKGNTDAAIANRAAVRNVVRAAFDEIDAMRRAGQSKKNLTDRTEALKKRLYTQFRQMGLSRAEAHRYANQMETLKDKINNVKGKKVTVTVEEKMKNKLRLEAIAKAHGAVLLVSGKPMYNREGGPIRGPGTGTSDSIPAMLSHGEYVIKASRARQLGTRFLDMLNGAKSVGGDFGALVLRFARGGSVGATQAFVRAQKGERYLLGGAGPNTWDCSGITGAAYALLRGLGYGHGQRYFTTQSNFGGLGFRRGYGAYTIGVSPQAGHMVGNIGGLPFEAARPGVPVRVGSSATSVKSMAQQWFLSSLGGVFGSSLFTFTNADRLAVMRQLRIKWGFPSQGRSPINFDRGGHWPSGTAGVNLSGHTETVIPGGGKVELSDRTIRKLGNQIGWVVLDGMNAASRRSARRADLLVRGGGLA
jgi:hypothetical protein